MPRGQGQTNKVALIVVADRTLGGRLLPLVDVAAVEADPGDAFLFFENSPIVDIGLQRFIAFHMLFFHLANQ